MSERRVREEVLYSAREEPRKGREALDPVTIIANIGICVAAYWWLGEEGLLAVPLVALLLAIDAVGVRHAGQRAAFATCGLTGCGCGFVGGGFALLALAMPLVILGEMGGAFFALGLTITAALYLAAAGGITAGLREALNEVNRDDAASGYRVGMWLGMCGAIAMVGVSIAAQMLTLL